MPLDRDSIQKGQYMVSDGGPAFVVSRSDPTDPPLDEAAEFDGHIERANAALDELAAIKARAKATKEWQDFWWRFG